MCASVERASVSPCLRGDSSLCCFSLQSRRELAITLLMKSPQLRASALIALLCMGLCASISRAQTSRPSSDVDQNYLRENYTKYEYRIPMRDGVKLFTAVYSPKDDSTPYPLLLTRTPYGLKPYGVDRYPDPSGPML